MYVLLTCCLFAVIRSVLESADQALRQKSRHPSILSSVVRSPPLKSSVQRIGSESSQSERQFVGDVRTVVHTKSRDSLKHDRRHHGSSRLHHHSSSGHQRSVAERTHPGSSEQLLITVTEAERSATADDQNLYRSAVSERKESILDEDQFEPDYDEGEMAVETEHKPRRESTTEDGKHRHRHSCRTSSQSDPAAKSKKHKKHKKSKKHKSKSKKSEK